MDSQPATAPKPEARSHGTSSCNARSRAPAAGGRSRKCQSSHKFHLCWILSLPTQINLDAGNSSCLQIPVKRVSMPHVAALAAAMLPLPAPANSKPLSPLSFARPALGRNRRLGTTPTNDNMSTLQLALRDSLPQIDPAIAELGPIHRTGCHYETDPLREHCLLTCVLDCGGCSNGATSSIQP
jgi:hypothetical protein